jgi:hypothetical protein
LPACLLFAVVHLPGLIELLSGQQWRWVPIGENGVFVALRYALASSMAGFLIWYLVGRFLPDSLPTGRWVLGVQVFDVWVGAAAVAVLVPVMGSTLAAATDTGQVLQALLQWVQTQGEGRTTIHGFLTITTLVGVLGSLPILLLFSLLYTGQIRRDALFIVLLLAVPMASVLLISSPGQLRLSWFGWPLSVVFSTFSLSLVAPLLALLLAIWVGWILKPNQVLKQVNPKTGARFWAWRLSLKFVVPTALALTFARASLGLVEVTAWDILGVLVALLLLWQGLRWARAL